MAVLDVSDGVKVQSLAFGTTILYVGNNSRYFFDMVIHVCTFDAVDSTCEFSLASYIFFVFLVLPWFTPKTIVVH